jgi:nuclear pore complex protein Nup133
MGKMIGDYFEQYGEDFAFPAYEVMLETRGVSAVLDFAQDKQGFKTQFLRSKPELAKLSWVNDVDREKDVKHAAATLLNLGLNREQQIWCKKIEISLGKLALLAEEAEEHQSEADDEANASTLENIDKIDRELELIRIQEALYDQILPSIAVAIDESAEVQLAMQAHGPRIAKNQKQRLLMDIFENALVRLLKHEALDPLSLIDLLTLCHLKPEHVVEMGDQFFLALRVASLGLKGNELTDAMALIWRRCYVRDDWKAINETNDKADIVQLEALGSTAAYSAMFAVVERRKSTSPRPLFRSFRHRRTDITADKQEESFFPVMRPSESLGVYTDHLDRRFNDMDDTFRNRLIEAMKQEDVKLRTFIEKHQLDAWHRTVLEEAEKSVAREYDMQIKALASSSQAQDDGSKEDDDAARKEGARLL